MIRMIHYFLLLLALIQPSLHARELTKKVLYFTKSSGYEHAVVKRHDGQLSLSERILCELGSKYSIEFTCSKDGRLFTPEYLAQFDAFCFYTSGDLLSPGRDGNPPLTLKGKEALLTAIKQGKGFIGIHSATDTFHKGETAQTNTKCDRAWRYRNLQEDADPYTRVIGAELILHGEQQVAKARIIDPAFPGFADKGTTIELMEEWYSMTDFSTDMHALLVMETNGMKGAPYDRPCYPNTWARMHGKGRVFYTALGHREDVWTNPLFQELLLEGILWALGLGNPSVTPNLAQTAPHASQLPPISMP